MVAHTFNLSTWEAEATEFLSSRPAWSTEFQASQGYTEKPCLTPPPPAKNFFFSPISRIKEYKKDEEKLKIIQAVRRMWRTGRIKGRQ
jgi:hypothetical protein